MTHYKDDIMTFYRRKKDGNEVYSWKEIELHFTE